MVTGWEVGVAVVPLENGHPEVSRSMIHFPSAARQIDTNRYNQDETQTVTHEPEHASSDSPTHLPPVDHAHLTVQGNQDLCANSQDEEALASIGIAQAGIFADHPNTSPHGQQQQDGDVDLQAQRKILVASLECSQYASACVCVQMYMRMHTHTHHINVFIYLSIQLFIYLLIYIFIYLLIFIYIYIYTYLYLYLYYICVCSELL